MSFRDRVGLDWLRQSNTSPSLRPMAFPEAQASDALELAVMLYGQKLLSALLTKPQQSGKLHDLVKDLGMKLFDAVSVVKRLSERGWIEVSDVEDPLENYLIKLTDVGRKIVS